MIVDGGDGVINGTDYILFFANGPDEWIKDSTNLRFSHRKNIYSNKAYYFLTVGGNGKRIPTVNNITSPSITINTFSERNFHELDSVNFLSSGKEWYGEEFSNAPGRQLSRSLTLNIPGLQINSPLLLSSNCVARSIGAVSKFDVIINNALAGQITINPTSAGQYDLFAQESTVVNTAISSQSNVGIGYTYTPGSFNSQGWLNWFELFCRRNLSLNGTDQLLFRDWLSVGNNNGEFVVSNANTNTQVWEITDPINPVRMQGSLVNNEIHFINDCMRLREYVAFNNNFLIPEAAGKVANQDLHNTSPTDLLIVTHPSLLPQAQRLAQIHQHQNSIRILVVTTDHAYNEFVSGKA